VRHAQRAPRNHRATMAETPREKWIVSSDVKKLMKAAKDSAETLGTGVPGTEYIAAMKTVITIFDLIPGMSIASGDMKGNVTKMEKKLAEYSVDTLQKAVEKELAEKDIKANLKIDDSACNALLWLTRALNFIKFLVEKLIECEMGPDGKPVEVDGKPKRKMNTLSTCIQHGYDNSLRPHHGMVVRGTFAVASKAAGVMGRESFLKKLDESDEAACASLEGMVADFGYVQDINDKFVREKGLETK